jgi:uncharacterized protein (DUF488 family)
MKVAFLLKELFNLNGTAYYDFIPYKYGAYSFQLNQDLIKLCEINFIQNSEGYRTNTAFNFNNEAIKEAIVQYKEYSVSELENMIYEEYPYYTLNSKIHKKTYSPEKKDGVYTIGYEGISVDTFLNRLIQNSIDLVADVRAVPLSRKYGFSGRQLENILSKINIKYSSVKDLGVADGIRKRMGEISREEYLYLYEVSLKNKTKQLEEISQTVNSSGNVAILCFEKNHEECHRSVVSKHIQTDKKVIHIESKF